MSSEERAEVDSARLRKMEGVTAKVLQGERREVFKQRLGEGGGGGEKEALSIEEGGGGGVCGRGVTMTATGLAVDHYVTTLWYCDASWPCIVMAALGPDDKLLSIFCTSIPRLDRAITSMVLGCYTSTPLLLFESLKTPHIMVHGT